MRFRPLVHFVCAAAFSILFAGGFARPLAAAPRAQAAQKPAAAAEKSAGEAFKNVQVLKDVPASKFMPTMFFIAASLGVGCEHCHVTSENGPWPLEKDDKKEKQTAREMMKMMQAINDQNFAGKQEVTCATCHAGHAEPVALSPVLPLGAKHAAEEPAGDKQLPTADQVLDSYVEAIGGTAALEKLKTREIKGALVTESGRTYTLEIRQKAPGLGLVTATSPKGDVLRDGYDGTMAWNAAGSSVFPSRGLEGARIARDAQFFVATDVKKRFPRRFVAGKESAGAEEVYLVRAGGHSDVSEMLYFSVNSGLLVRRIVLTQTALGRFSEQTEYSDYREADGVKLPFTVARMEVNTRYTEKFSEVKHNIPISDSAFQMPVGPK